MKRKPFQKKASLYTMYRQDNGIVFIATLALLAIITLVGTTAFYTTNTDIKISGNYKTSTQAFYLAEAGIHDGIGRLMSGTISDSGAKLDPNWNVASTYSSSGLNNSFTVTHHVIGGSVVSDDAGTPLFLITSTGTSSASTKTIEAVVRLIYALPFTKALEGCDGISVSSDVLTDSYDSAKGDYLAQVIDSTIRKDAKNFEWAGDKGNVSTANANADILIDGNAQIHGNAKATRYVGISGTGIPTTGLGTPASLTGYKGSPDTNSTNAVIYGIPTENNPPTPCDPLNILTLFNIAEQIEDANDNAELSDPPYDSGSKTFDLDSNDTYTVGAAGQSRNYYFTDFNLDSHAKLYVNGAVTFYLAGDFFLSSNAEIELFSGSSLTIYVTETIDFNSNTITNPNEPMDFAIYSSKTSSNNTDYKVSLDSNTELVGTIYAPYAAIDLNSNSISAGAIRGKYINTGANATFHYDEALGRLDGYPITGFEIISWREVN